MKTTSQTEAEIVPALTAAEQASIDSFIMQYEKNALLHYLKTENTDRDRNLILKNIEYLVSQGADATAKDYYGTTPLHWTNNVDVAKFFVSQGADVNAKDNEGTIPLDNAESRGNPALVEYLSCLK